MRKMSEVSEDENITSDSAGPATGRKIMLKLSCLTVWRQQCVQAVVFSVQWPGCCTVRAAPGGFPGAWQYQRDRHTAHCHPVTGPTLERIRSPTPQVSPRHQAQHLHSQSEVTLQSGLWGEKETGEAEAQLSWLVYESQTVNQ